MTSDLLVRTLKYLGYETNYVMNLTDVGHLTGDNLGDADTGEDRLEKAAKREAKSAWDIAKFYGGKFLSEFSDLNLIKPNKYPKATNHISEQIALIEKLQKNGLTYETSDGVYFDTKEYERATGKKYGELSDLDKIKEGARVEKNVEKKNPRDFALWKFSKKGEGRQMEWESPWGVGFPGWHIECSAMSMKYLGETLDIHIGGEDLRSTHHPNEIAQSEGATGKPFVKYWVHGAFLKVDGGRMGKSLGNAYSLGDIKKRGIDPLALKLFYYSAYYRDSLNFTWEALEGSQNALNNLYERVRELKASLGDELSSEKLDKIDNFRSEFRGYLEDDLDMPKVMAVVWSTLKSNLPSRDKLDLLYDFDDVLGLNLRGVEEAKIPQDLIKLAKKREEYRQKGDFAMADKIREKIENQGFIIKDGESGAKLSRRSAFGKKSNE
ncbi:MAG: Cysteine-tRNA ligase [Candidatus Woesebacteria bacterium GW2011_GWB1_43_14]|uniref:Cysteine--tRNA ligase n=1 Tax=Candidatus Woesebacteria bacterium GW2011_GWB1_43_14 TaxID=1618578 RepID=A0A0G1DGY9_9BACT|nr:MAG: Cysteine-tRNA ligase [Candidatus Woesebacteria bacterium GW2011_GWA1_39_11b]KKS77728.1 MAG: Cysteine-tRNA ligase [Candidatus Woesebacteria bacterium GW2011_GWC1_42_9]KKS96964.1 MAG: Cysteine-tRNA ligase [Candidatus Woesebacteria bacterium GW2011_GWB1_43_14]